MGQPFDPSGRPNYGGQPPPAGQPVPPWQPGPPAQPGPGSSGPDHHEPDYYGPLNAPVPADRPSPYAPSAAPGPRPPRPWGAAIIGLVVGLLLAAGVGAVLVKTKTLRIGSTSADSGVSNAAITLPATVGGFADIVQAMGAIGSDSAQRTKAVTFRKETEAKTEALTKAAYEKAYPGAAVAYRGYGSPDLMLLVSVIAVRAPSPGLTLGPVGDPATLGVAVLPQQIKIFGEVQCQVVQQQTTPAGKPVDPEKESTVLCQRSGANLTVRVSGGVFDGPEEQQQMIALTNAVWTAISG